MGASLRGTVAEANARAGALDAAVRKFKDATTEADYATETLICVMGEAETALRRLRDAGQPAERAADSARRV